MSSFFPGAPGNRQGDHPKQADVEKAEEHVDDKAGVVDELAGDALEDARTEIGRKRPFAVGAGIFGPFPAQQRARPGRSVARGTHGIQPLVAVRLAETVLEDDLGRRDLPGAESECPGGED